MEVSETLLRGVLILLAVVPFLLAIALTILEGSVWPRLIPRSEIERLADAMVARCPGDPETAAFVEEQAAWFRSETFEQGQWKRVRKRLRRRCARKVGDLSP